jgi:hypothetical protein
MLKYLVSLLTIHLIAAAIVKLVAEVEHVVPPQRAYDFSFARQAEQQLIKQGWKP